MKKIAHIINPVIFNESSALCAPQPVTFETMRAARDFASRSVEVDLYSAQTPEDHPFVPEDFIATRDLDRSVLDFGVFRKKRKLPLIRDILNRLYEASEAEYLIYTNVDISLMPQFYLAVNGFIEEGNDAFIINRRTISSRHKRIEEIPLMYSELGRAHPGHDCFVFKRDVYRGYRLGDVCIGAPFVGRTLLFNLACSAKNFRIFT